MTHRPTDVVTGAEALSAWSRLTPDERKAARAAADRVSGSVQRKNAPSAIAILQGPFPNGAAVMVLRDTNLPYNRVFVLSTESLDAKSLYLAIQALNDDEELMPLVHHQRLLSISQHGRVAVGAGEAFHRVKHMPDETDRMTIQIERLLEVATSSQVADLPGVGRVKLFRFD